MNSFQGGQGLIEIALWADRTANQFLYKRKVI